jgi:hypothetical protein
MEWLLLIVAGFVLLLITAPLVMLLLTVFVLVPLAHLLPTSSGVARATFECPVRHERVDAAFVVAPEGGTASDVVACSAFGGGPVTCAKKCRELTRGAWAPSPMVPRFALVSDDVVIR